MWITQNYILYQGLGVQESFPFRKISDVRTERTQLFLEGLAIGLGPDRTVPGHVSVASFRDL